MHLDGFTNMVSVDYSSVVIAKMKQQAPFLDFQVFVFLDQRGVVHIDRKREGEGEREVGKGGTCFCRL